MSIVSFENRVKIRKLLAHLLNTSMKSHCYHCTATWNWVEKQAVPYDSTHGIIFLCTDCFRNLLPSQTLGYAKDLIVNVWGNSWEDYKNNLALAVFYLLGILSEPPFESELMGWQVPC